MPPRTRGRNKKTKKLRTNKKKKERNFFVWFILLSHVTFKLEQKTKSPVEESAVFFLHNVQHSSIKSPTKSLRSHERKVIMETKEKNSTLKSYCCSFNRIFKLDLSLELKRLFCHEVDKLVLSTSHLRHEVSILANYIVFNWLATNEKRESERYEKGLFYLNTNESWVEFYKSCLNIIIESSKSKEKEENQTDQIIVSKNINSEKQKTKGDRSEQKNVSVFLPLMKSRNVQEEEESNSIWEYQKSFEKVLNNLNKTDKNSFEYYDKEKNMEFFSLLFELWPSSGVPEKNVEFFSLLFELWPCSDFPYHIILQGYETSKDLIAREMATNTQISLCVNLEQRQKTTLLSTWNSSLVHKMIILINCSREQFHFHMKECKQKLQGLQDKKLKAKRDKNKIQLLQELETKEVQNVIESHRRIIRDNKEEWDNQTISKIYRKNNSWILLKYNYFLLQIVERIRNNSKNNPCDPLGEHDSKVKVFNLLPNYNCSRHSIEIQRKVFLEILQHLNYNCKGCTLENIILEKEKELWNEWFTFEGIIPKSKNRELFFQYKLTTNGLKVICPFFYIS